MSMKKLVCAWIFIVEAFFSRLGAKTILKPISHKNTHLTCCPFNAIISVKKIDFSRRQICIKFQFP